MNRGSIQIIVKALAPKTALKVVETFDRITTLVVGVCWAAAAIMVGFALYSVNASSKAKHDAEAAMVAEPSLPVITRKKVTTKDVKAMIDQMQRRYPTINTVFRSTLVISATDGSKFRDWLGVLEAVDTINPKIRWSFDGFCVGKCGGSTLMEATLVGEQIVFEKPQVDVKK